jgi:hypothetical protein
MILEDKHDLKLDICMLQLERCKLDGDFRLSNSPLVKPVTCQQLLICLDLFLRLEYFGAKPTEARTVPILFPSVAHCAFAIWE